ncbi:MerR family transcriptional regulator [Ligilactobacillus apodemi]|uniref:MerR family transcriptional regulator n=1 Tax=Ligilactobacillus apodemi TaxID=307126 RepID=UPI00214AFE28|nr:MerR family transcriptional regulator [Ligilactobacillus apodemi]MCR1901787.1 MerR family transcriptional regulator [Ligilactobacillus apodemi]
MNMQEVATKVGISPDTVRYWERIGIILPFGRDQQGIRNFSHQDLEWLKYAKLLNEMEVSLDFQIEYVKLVKLGKKAKPARKDLLNEQLAKLTASYHCLVERIIEMDTMIEKQQSA